MILDLLRHGHALAEAMGGDRERRLSPAGRDAIRALGERLQRVGAPPACVFASPYARARETAEIVLRAWGPTEPPEPELLVELAPDADPDAALRTIAARAGGAQRVLVVAHQPLLGRIVLRACGVERSLAPGTLVRIEWAPGSGPGLGRLLQAFEPT